MKGRGNRGREIKGDGRGGKESQFIPERLSPVLGSLLSLSSVSSSLFSLLPMSLLKPILKLFLYNSNLN